jgi:hypothetical protein
MPDSELEVDAPRVVPPVFRSDEPSTLRYKPDRARPSPTPARTALPRVGSDRSASDPRSPAKYPKGPVARALASAAVELCVGAASYRGVPPANGLSALLSAERFGHYARAAAEIKARWSSPSWSPSW